MTVPKFIHTLNTALERKMYEAIKEAGSRKEVDLAKACAEVAEKEINQAREAEWWGERFNNPEPGENKEA